MSAAAMAMAVPESDPIRDVRATLKGPVAKVLRQLVPELAGVSLEATYDHAMGSIYLLERCFRAFRGHRERFRHVLVDGDGQVVTEDGAPMSCGRSLEQVVAMIVRTTARRYFRHHLGGGPATARCAPIAGARGEGVLGRLLPFAQPKPANAAPSAADELYDAIKSYLLFDWQVPLVPAYAKLEPAQVKEWGSRLLDYDDPVKLARAMRLPPPAPAVRPVATLVAQPASEAEPVADSVPEPAKPTREEVLLARVLASDGKRLDALAFTESLLSPEVRRVLPGGEVALHPTAILGSVGAEAAIKLVGRLGLTIDQLSVLLLGAYETMGGQAFLRVFGHGSEPELMDRLGQHARRAGIGPDSSLDDVAAFVAMVFGRVKAPAAGPRA